MDFEPCFKVYNLVSIRPKSMKLGQMINLNVIFHMVGSVYRLVTIRNSPQFPVEFRNGLSPERWGGLRKNPFPGRGMDILWNCTFKN